MLRHCAVVLVLAGLMGRLVIPVAHSHAELSPQQRIEHNVKPHFHVGLTSHGHPHGDSDHVHSHDDPAEHSHDPVEKDGTVEAQIFDHDANAIWLTGASTASFVIKSSAKQLSLADDLGHVDVFIAAKAAQSNESSSYDARRCPRAPAAGLYIILRTLRI